MFRNAFSGLVRQRAAFNGFQRRTFAGGHGPKKEGISIGELMILMLFCLLAGLALEQRNLLCLHHGNFEL